MAQQIEKVGVLGAGLMGHGIAQVAAQAGYEVVLREVDEATLRRGSARSRSSSRAPSRRGSPVKRMPMRCARASTGPSTTASSRTAIW